MLSSLLLALGQYVPVQWKHFQWECLGPSQAANSHLLGIYNPSSPVSSPPWCWAAVQIQGGCCCHCHAAGVGLGLGPVPCWSQAGPQVGMAQVAHGFAPQAPAAALAGAGAGLPVGAHGQEPLGHCPPTTGSFPSAGSPAAFFLRNQFLLLKAVLRKPSKTAKHGMQNKIQSEGLNYSRTENTQLIKSARHQPCWCAGPKAALCLHVLLCSGPCWPWGGGRAESCSPTPPRLNPASPAAGRGLHLQSTSSCAVIPSAASTEPELCSISE